MLVQGVNYTEPTRTRIECVFLGIERLSESTKYSFENREFGVGRIEGLPDDMDFRPLEVKA